MARIAKVAWGLDVIAWALWCLLIVTGVARASLAEFFCFFGHVCPKTAYRAKREYSGPLCDWWIFFSVLGRKEVKKLHKWIWGDHLRQSVSLSWLCFLHNRNSVDGIKDVGVWSRLFGRRNITSSCSRCYCFTGSWESEKLYAGYDFLSDYNRHKNRGRLFPFMKKLREKWKGARLRQHFCSRAHEIFYWNLICILYTMVKNSFFHEKRVSYFIKLAYDEVNSL